MFKIEEGIVLKTRLSHTKHHFLRRTVQPFTSPNLENESWHIWATPDEHSDIGIFLAESYRGAT